ncbi:MAG: hypothetical protein Q9159_005915 [Coniocarpon cinnabarinum]
MPLHNATGCPKSLSNDGDSSWICFLRLLCSFGTPIPQDFLLAATRPRSDWDKNGELVVDQPQPSAWLSVDISSFFQNPETVSQGLKRLEEANVITYCKEQHIQITPQGRARAGYVPSSDNNLAIICQAWPTQHATPGYTAQVIRWWNIIGDAQDCLVELARTSTGHLRRSFANILLTAAIARRAPQTIELIKLVDYLMMFEKKICFQHEVVAIQLSYLTGGIRFQGLLDVDARVSRAKLSCIEYYCRLAKDGSNQQTAERFIRQVSYALSDQRLTPLVHHACQSLFEYGATLYFHLGRLDEAAKLVRKALSSQIRDDDLRSSMNRHLARVLCEEGKPQEAFEPLRQAAEYPPHCATTNLEYAELCLQSTRLYIAKAYLGKMQACLCGIPFSSIRVSVNRARMAYLYGDYQEAIRRWTEIIATPNVSCSSTVYYSLSCTYSQAQDDGSALRWRREAEIAEVSPMKVKWYFIWGFEGWWRQRVLRECEDAGIRLGYAKNVHRSLEAL